MRQYRYKATDAGLSAWPQGELRLTGIEETDNPREADLFVVPGMLTALFPTTAAVQRLPYFKGNEARHVFFDCSDNEPLYRLPCLFIRCNTRTWYLPTDPNTISWPWPVDDYAECEAVPEGGFKYDVTFQGWNWSNVRKEVVLSCAGMNGDIQTYSDFTGYIWDTEEGHRRRREFRRSMKESRLALCPESIPGVFPYRFFEAMSAGRMPVLIGSDYVLPFEAEIPYGSFCLFYTRSQASTVGDGLQAFLATSSDEEIIHRGTMARMYWEKYLHRDKWPELMAYAIKTRLSKTAGLE